MAPGVRQSQSRGRKERKSILEATAELITVFDDRGKVPDIGTVDWEVGTEKMEGRAHSRTCVRGIMRGRSASVNKSSTHKKTETGTCLI